MLPHLDPTYFLSQAFWCIFVFLLVYLTISKKFHGKYSHIISVREKKVLHYIKDAENMIKEADDIEKQIEESRRLITYEVKKLEGDAKRNMLLLKEQRMTRLKNEIERKNQAHTLYLDGLRGKILLDFNDYAKNIEEKMNAYLFGR
jgi:F0F1-type ATP synthase membrane subunit b/b'